MNVGSPTFTQSPKRPIARAPDLNLLQLVKIEFKNVILKISSRLLKRA